MRSVILALLFLLWLPACSVETDRSLYTAGEDALARLHNGSPIPAWLPGCAPFELQRSLDGDWVDQGPPWVCIWEGLAVLVAPGSTLTTPFQAPADSGLYRLRYPVSLGCSPGLPLSQADCVREQSVFTDPFEVEREACEADEPGCRFVPLAPNFLCADGESVGGPSGVCTRDPGSGQCGYEFLECP
ncbi:MAG: hypothetical protein QNK05_20320 [Myxococcota bacterium]|nr:hypothetical protein [Myxococcota bacterium]